jgi:hypothetical protein
VRKSKDSSGAKLRTGVAVGGVVGVGVAMMFAQFLTLGLLTIATAGGAAAGYGLRVRQEKRLRIRDATPNRERLIASSVDDLPALEAQTPALSRRRKRPKNAD